MKSLCSNGQYVIAITPIRSAERTKARWLIWMRAIRDREFRPTVSSMQPGRREGSIQCSVFSIQIVLEALIVILILIPLLPRKLILRGPCYLLLLLGAFFCT